MDSKLVVMEKSYHENFSLLRINLMVLDLARLKLSVIIKVLIKLETAYMALGRSLQPMSN